MQPMKQDLSIFNKFDFERPPVGVKFLFDKPEGIERIDKSLPLCEMIKEAQQRGTPFYLDKENENCFGKAVLGMEDVPSFAESGQVGYKLEIYKEARANQRLYQYITKLIKILLSDNTFFHQLKITIIKMNILTIIKFSL